MAFSTNDGMQALLFRLIVGATQSRTNTRLYRCKGESSRRNTSFICTPGIGRRYFFWPPRYKKEQTINIDAGDIEFIYHTCNFKVCLVGKWSNYWNFKTNERSRYYIWLPVDLIRGLHTSFCSAQCNLRDRVIITGARHRFSLQV